MTITVLDANNLPFDLQEPPPPGRAAANASGSVAACTEDKAVIDAIAASLVAIGGNTDGIEALLTAIGALLTTQSGYLDGVETLLGGQSTVLTAIQTLLTTQATYLDGVEALLAYIRDIGKDYEFVAAGQPDVTLGGAGALGDTITGLLIMPSATSPGAVSIKDNDDGTPIIVFPGGAGSVSSLVPFLIPLGVRSKVGEWHIATGANVTVLATGNFT